MVGSAAAASPIACAACCRSYTGPLFMRSASSFSSAVPSAELCTFGTLSVTPVHRVALCYLQRPDQMLFTSQSCAGSGLPLSSTGMALPQKHGP